MVNTGAVIEVIEGGVFDRSTGWSKVTFRNGERARVTRVSTAGKLLVAKPGRGNGAAWFTADKVRVLEDGTPTAPAPRPRQIGVMPTEGDHIAIDDPRIAWIWEDAGKVADQHGHCGEYDSLTEKLGAPGRVRAFNVTTKIEGLDAVLSIMARSKKEASAKVVEKFADAKVSLVQDTGRRR